MKIHFVKSEILAKDERTACGRRTDNLCVARRWALVTCEYCFKRHGKQRDSVRTLVSLRSNDDG